MYTCSTQAVVSLTPKVPLSREADQNEAHVKALSCGNVDIAFSTFALNMDSVGATIIGESECMLHALTEDQDGSTLTGFFSLCHMKLEQSAYSSCTLTSGNG